MSLLARGGELAYKATKRPDKIPTYLAYKFRRNVLAKVTARRLRSLDDPSVARLGAALYETAAEELEPAERTWVAKLEDLRAEIDATDETVTVVDYGAGSRNDDRNGGDGDGVTRAIQVNELAKSNYAHCLLLFKLIRKTEPKRVLEMGTSVGISAAYQGAALALNGEGRVTTLEGSDTIATLAEENLDSLGLDTVDVSVGRFQEQLSRHLENCSELDMVFVDGHHDGDATIAYFERLWPHLSENAIVIFDDIHWSEDMERAWETIRVDDRISTTVDTGQMAICSIRDDVSGTYSVLL